MATQDGEPHEVPAWAHNKLVHASDFVVRMLTELTTATRVGPDKVKIPAMPKSAVRHTQGLALIRKTKKGAVFSFTTEKAFVLNKIHDADGSVRWSAPVFMQGSSVGVGCSLGYMRTDTCLALMNDKAVELASHGRGDWGCNWNFLVDMNSSRIKKVTFDSAAAPSQVSTDRHGCMLAKYYQVDAALVDMSVRGGNVKPNWALNRAVYGPGVDLDEVLAGNVPPPAEFQPVYDLLNQFILETAPAQKADRRGSRHGAPDDQHYPPHLALGGGGGGGISRPPSAEAGGLPRPRSRPPKGEQQQQYHHQQQEQQRRSSGDG